MRFSDWSSDVCSSDLLRIDNAPATDPSGFAGLTAKVDFHTWTLLKGVALATLLGVGSELSISGESDLVAAIREAPQQNVSRAGHQLTSPHPAAHPPTTTPPAPPPQTSPPPAPLPPPPPPTHP